MRKRNTESVGEVLRQFFEDNPFFKRKLAESRAVTGWSKLLGSMVASYTTNIYLRNGILYVSLSSSVLRSELLMAKDKLIAKLNEHAGMHVVNDIIFR
jgi:predicted nucleic acid-binding Zn ribbon protein